MPKIYLDSRKKLTKTLEKLYTGARIIDVTSKATDEFVKFSPFYPHGNIPVPFSEGKTAMCVEGIWQGLKVFESQDVDLNSFANAKMKNIKRTIAKFGKPLGHRKGIDGKEFLNYLNARIEIYLPSYLWVLENKLQDLLAELKNYNGDIVLLDYDTNSDLYNLQKPLSHASLIKAYLENRYLHANS